jgi:voltage-gated potassium channel
VKSVLAVITALQRSRTSRQNIALLIRFLLVLAGLITLYTVLFHLLMEWEGQKHSWLSGFYWTLVTMSTLGFGDITFDSDLGRVFSMVVIVSGVFFLLVLLPFTFIEFFYAPWMRAQAEARAPRELPATTRGHVIMTQHGPITSTLIPMLKKYGYAYAILATSVAEALELTDKDLTAVVGDLDDPESYRRLRVTQAALVVTSRSDMVNTNITFTVRELDKDVPIISLAVSDSARGVLELAGATYVLRLEVMLGRALARRVLGTDAVSHEVGSLDGLIVAEANAAGTPLVGKELRECGLRRQTGVSVIGIWDHGRFIEAKPETRIKHNTAFILAGTAEQMEKYNELMCIYHLRDAPVLIIGAGGVGRAAAEALEQRALDYRILERKPGLARDSARTLIGDASDTDFLQQAGIKEAASLIITSRDDDTNIYLTILCRRLCPDLQILSRCTFERNVATLHRAGADLVLSYGSMGANAIFNLLRGRETLLMAEGLNIFTAPVPPDTAGKTIADSEVRSRTGCTIIAVENAGRREINPPPEYPLPEGGDLVLIGSLEAEEKFLATFVQNPRKR